MRRTITTLMFLAVGGLISAANAADTRDGSWQYYAAGQSSYRISDDDDDAAPAAQSNVATVGHADQSTQERNALYVADGMGSGLAQTSFLQGDCGCNQNACGCNNGCNQCGSISGCMGDCTCDLVRIEWLGWFSRGRNAPPLVTTSPVGTAQADAGVLGVPGTTTLYGNDPIGTQLRNGGRITYSHLFADGITTGTFRFWGISNGAETFSTTSANNPIIARPYFDTTLGTGNAFLVAYPGLTTPGSIIVTSKNSLLGIDAWGSRNWYNDGGSSIDVLGGYQFTRMDDSINIASSSTTIGGNLPVGSLINLTDNFRTRNEFNGGSLGFIARSYRGPITLEALGKVALGNMRESVIVNGNAAITPPGGATLNSGSGLYAQPSNIGSVHHDVIAYVPEINVNLLYNINQSWRAMVGYSFIYWNNVVLAGNQIDTNLTTPLPTATAPPFPKFQRTDFWVQGISLGADYRF